MSELEFSTKLEQVSVIIDKKKYTLRELDGESRDEYMDLLNERMNVTEEGKVSSVIKYAGIRTRRVSDSLFDDQGKNVSLTVVGKFPSSVLQVLFEKAQELSGIGDTATEEVKND